MVEHILRDDPIDRWLSHSPSREVWWVAQDPTKDPGRVSSWTMKPAREITGEIGRPQVFFQQLAFRLAGVPDAPLAEEQLEVAFEAVAEPVSQSAPLAETLRNEILRNQYVLFNLDQESLEGERPPQ